MTSSIARRGFHYMQKRKASKSVIENGQNRVIDASLTLIREKAKHKAS